MRSILALIIIGLIFLVACAPSAPQAPQEPVQPEVSEPAPNSAVIDTGDDQPNVYRDLQTADDTFDAIEEALDELE